MECYCGIQMSNGDYICHHGVKGQKWGKRRYQNEDGSLINPSHASAQTRKVISDHNRMSDKDFKHKYYVSKKTYAKRVGKMGGDPYKYRTDESFRRKTKYANAKGMRFLSGALKVSSAANAYLGGRSLGLGLATKNSKHFINAGLHIATSILKGSIAGKIDENVKNRRKDFDNDMKKRKRK